MPDGPVPETHHHRRARHATRLSLESDFGSNRTCPTDAGGDIEADQVGFHNKNCFVVGCAA